MAGIPRLRSTEDLNTDRFLRVLRGEYRRARLHYDRELDTLLLLIVPPETETIAHPIDETLALLYDARTLEVVGVQVEDFERSFVPAHERLQSQWHLGPLETAPQDVGDLIIIAEEREPRITREVVRVTEGVLAAAC